MNPLELLEDPLRAVLDFLHEDVNLTYGWCIVVLTMLVRLCLLPLVIKQYSSMRRMQMYAPQMKELQQKYKGNRSKLNEEMMAFYKENEINPFSSCLPLAAQIPVFIALYYVLRGFASDATVSGGDVSFMWIIPDVRIDFTEIGWGVIVMVAIYATSQLLSMELSTTPNMSDSQRRLMRVLPLGVVVFLFIYPVPAGLVLYWMTTNLWTCGQQLVLRHRIGLHLADPAEVEKMTAKQTGSRTPPKEAVAAAVAEAPGEERRRQTPRKRRRRGEAEANGGAPAEAAANGAPEPQADAPGEDADATVDGSAPPAQEAAVPSEPAPPADDAGTEAEADAIASPEPEAEPAPAEASTPAEDGRPVEASARSGSGSGGARRRQPRAKGTAKGSRPAPSRSKKKKR